MQLKMELIADMPRDERAVQVVVQAHDIATKLHSFKLYLNDLKTGPGPLSLAEIEELYMDYFQNFL